MGAWSLRGYGRADYSHTHISGFQESGGIAGGVAYTNTVNSQSILSATSTLGAELSYAFSTNTLAAVIIPRLYAEWVHEFKNSGRQMQTTLRATGMNKEGKTFNVPAPISLISVAGPERNWANVGAGVQMLFPHAIVGYLNYDTLFIENASNQTVSGGIRMNF
jgi:outer membrane autotransporter protein